MKKPPKTVSPKTVPPGVPGHHWAADEIVAPGLIALKAWYDEARGAATKAERPMVAFQALPHVETLPGVTDLAILEVRSDGTYPYIAIGDGYCRTAEVGGGPGLQRGPDGVVAETRAVIRQHFGMAIAQRGPFHVSVTRWDGPKILQYDRLILPLDDGKGGAQGGEITHLLVGEAFLRLAKTG